MSAEAARTPAATASPQGKLIVCIIADDGTDVSLLKALRTEKGLVAASSLACRGLGAVGLSLRRRRLPQPEAVKSVSVLVPPERADEIFEFLFERADIEGRRSGLIYQSAVRLVTPFTLPADIGDEE